jgi:hypothetical protein
MPRAKGSSSAIRKRSSHITVVVADAKPATEKVTEKTAKAKPANKKEEAK